VQHEQRLVALRLERGRDQREDRVPGELTPFAPRLPCRDVQRELPTRGPGVNVAGSFAQPPMLAQLGYSTTASSSISKSGRRVSTAVSTSANSMRARCDPTQRWMPTPNDR